MSTTHTRIAAYTSALFLAALTVASAATHPAGRNVSAHGFVDHTHGFVAHAHGMMASQKRHFFATHHFSSRKAGRHGFTSSATNGRRHPG
ncbi:MAG: hypothetical protein ACREMP_00150 [Candidatus Tyrphobacter sp.]